MLTTDFSIREGYGIYIRENLSWIKTFIIEAIFSTCWLVFAVIWCIARKGGIQDGFTTAGTRLAYCTIMFGVLHVLSQHEMVHFTLS